MTVCEFDKRPILIVDDHALTRFGLKTVFAAQNFISDIYEAGTFYEASSILFQHKPDIAIVDLGLPDVNGLELIKKIQEENLAQFVIAFTLHTSREDVIKAFKYGVRAFCNKEIAPEKLVEVVKHVLDGALWVDKSVSKYIIDNLALYGEMKEDKMGKYNFTSREIQVLKLLTEGLDNMEIAQKLAVSLHTVKAHMRGILQKLNVKDRTCAAITALKLFN